MMSVGGRPFDANLFVKRLNANAAARATATLADDGLLLPTVNPLASPRMHREAQRLPARVKQHFLAGAALHDVLKDVRRLDTLQGQARTHLLSAGGLRGGGQNAAYRKIVPVSTGGASAKSLMFGPLDAIAAKNRPATGGGARKNRGASVAPEPQLQAAPADPPAAPASFVRRPPAVIAVLGCIGSGTTSVSLEVAYRFGWQYVSAAQAVAEAIAAGTTEGVLAERAMKDAAASGGLLAGVSPHLKAKIIVGKMMTSVGNVDGFVVENFPSCMDDLCAFEDAAGTLTAVLHLEVNDACIRQRTRSTDQAAIASQTQAFVANTAPILQFCYENRMLHVLDTSDRSVAEIADAAHLHCQAIARKHGRFQFNALTENNTPVMLTSTTQPGRRPLSPPARGDDFTQFQVKGRPNIGLLTHELQPSGLVPLHAGLGGGGYSSFVTANHVIQTPASVLTAATVAPAGPQLQHLRVFLNDTMALQSSKSLEQACMVAMTTRDSTAASPAGTYGMSSGAAAATARRRESQLAMVGAYVPKDMGTRTLNRSWLRDAVSQSWTEKQVDVEDAQTFNAFSPLSLDSTYLDDYQAVVCYKACEALKSEGYDDRAMVTIENYGAPSDMFSTVEG